MDLHGIAYSAFVTCIFFIVLDTLALLVRLGVRARQKTLWIEDGLCFIGWAATMPYIAITIACTLKGGAPAGSAEYETGQKLQYFNTPIYFIGMAATKLSILWFYRRIFPNRKFVIASNIVMAVCLMWMIAAVVTGFLNCRPMDYFWGGSASGSCIDFATFFLAITIIDIVMDAVIMAMPFPLLMKLQLPLKKKISLMGIFAMGILVVITGIIRIVLVYEPGSLYDSQTKALMWSVIQLSVALLCSCALTYGPLLLKASLWGNAIKRYGSDIAIRFKSRRSSSQLAKSIESE